MTFLQEKGQRRRKIFEGLKDQGGLWIHVFQRAPIGVIGLDGEGKVWLWNKRAEDITGVKAEEALGRILPWAKEELKEVLKEAFGGKALHGLEFLQRKGEEERWMRLSVSPLEGPGGAVGGVVLFFWDVTEEKALSYALKQILDLLSSLADSTRAGLFLHRGGPFLYVNKAFRELTGFTFEELTAMPFWEVVHPEDRPLVRERAKKRLKGEEVPSCYEVRFLLKDGSVRWAELALAVVDYGGKPTIVGTAYDVTELKRVQEELYKANEELKRLVATKTGELLSVEREREVLLYSISHDLRAPLRAIEGFSELLWEGYREVLDEKGQRFLQNVLQASRRAAKMFEDLLKYVRLGKKGLQMSRVDLGILFKELLEGFDPSLLAQAKVLLKGPFPSLVSDETLLRLVFSNLLDNAFKYRKEGVPLEVEIGSWEEEGSLVLYVRDNGRGIPRDCLEKVFDLFQRLTVQGSPESTGVGLAIAKKAVELLGGLIWVTSELGQGSTFYVKLPLEVCIGSAVDRG